MRYLQIFTTTLLLYTGSAFSGTTDLLVEASPGDDQAARVQAAIASLDAGRQYYGRVRLVGAFRLERPIVLPDYTVLDLRQARLTAASGQDVLVTNEDWDGGNQHIAIVGGIVDGNRMRPPKGKGGHGIYLSRVENVRLEDLQVLNFIGDGIRVTGRGRRTRVASLDNIIVSGNGRYGLNVTWAMRQVQVSNVTALENGVIGVHIDHSEGQYLNIFADRNKGHGIYIRNVFGASYSNLTATRNGRAGIYVLGMVQSLGSNWAAHNNGLSKKSESGDIFFSAHADLSYGITKDTRIVGINAGRYSQFGEWKETQALEFESSDPRRSHPGLRLDSVNLIGETPGFLLVSEGEN